MIFFVVPVALKYSALICLGIKFNLPLLYFVDLDKRNVFGIWNEKREPHIHVQSLGETLFDVNKRRLKGHLLDLGLAKGKEYLKRVNPNPIRWPYLRSH